MAIFRVAYTGRIRGWGTNGYEKFPIPHRFEGGNGTPEIYSTEDLEAICVLRANPYTQEIQEVIAASSEEVVAETSVPEKKSIVGRVVDAITGREEEDEEPQENVGEEAEAPETAAASEEASQATDYREKVLGALAAQNYRTELTPMAKKYDISVKVGRVSRKKPFL